MTKKKLTINKIHKFLTKNKVMVIIVIVLGVIGSIIAIGQVIPKNMPWMHNGEKESAQSLTNYNNSNGWTMTMINNYDNNTTKYNPNTDIGYMKTMGCKDTPKGTRVTMRKGDFYGFVNINITLPGQKYPYPLGNLPIENYTVTLPIPLVYISYDKKDITLIKQISERLLNEEAILTWFEDKDLLPGDNRENKIKEAIETSDKVLFFFSNTSNNVSEDLSYALAIKEAIGYKKRYIIPIILDESDPPKQFEELIWLDMNEENAFEKLVKAIKED